METLLAYTHFFQSYTLEDFSALEVVVIMVYWCPYFVVWQDRNLLPFIFKAISYEQKILVFPTFRKTIQEVYFWIGKNTFELGNNFHFEPNHWLATLSILFYAVRNIFALGLLLIFQLFGWDGKSKYHTISTISFKSWF